MAIWQYGDMILDGIQTMTYYNHAFNVNGIYQNWSRTDLLSQLDDINGTTDEKMHIAFKIYDFDDKDKITKEMICVILNNIPFT